MQVYDSDVKPIPIISQMQGVWEKRGLLRLLVTRDLTVRYKRSVIGIWWSLLNPLFTTAVLFWVFNTVFKTRMPDGTAFMPYLLSGVLMMTFFNQGLNTAAEAIAQGAGVLTKVYVRPEVFAISAAISSAVNFALGLVPLTLVLLISGKYPGLLSPLVLVMMASMVMLTTGLGLFFSIAYITFDDFRSLIQILLLALQYMTPVFYPITALGPHTRIVIELNPLTSFIAVFRHVYGDNYPATGLNWLMMIASSALIFILGLWFFIKKWPKAVAKI
jgi:ABC-2 type transport system permease protein